MGRAFEKRKSTIFARADKMSKLFTRVGREIAMAVKSGGPNPDANPAHKRVMVNARAANMPKDKIEAAIKKASGQQATDYEIVIYEGYAPHGIAVLVETATDNVTRTVANVRMHFRENGGNFGTSGSVAFLFQKMGVFRLQPYEGDLGELELELLDQPAAALAGSTEPLAAGFGQQQLESLDLEPGAGHHGFGVTRTLFGLAARIALGQDHGMRSGEIWRQRSGAGRHASTKHSCKCI